MPKYPRERIIKKALMLRINDWYMTLIKYHIFKNKNVGRIEANNCGLSEGTLKKHWEIEEC